MKRIKYAALVYQAGIANVFACASLGQTDYGRAHRKPERMLQADFRTCENFARGLEAAGVVVKSFGCNQAGDIIHAQWSDDLGAQPFCDKFRPVGANWPVEAH